MADDVRLTFAEFNARVNAVAHGFVAAGIGTGNCVALMLENRLEFLLASYALKKVGAIEVALNCNFRGPSLVNCVNLTRAPIMITETAFLEALAAVSSELVHLQRVVLVDADDDGGAIPGARSGPFAELVSDRNDNPGIAIRDTDLATVLFTSGTTGASKGCMLSHRYAVHCGEYLGEALGLLEEDTLYCPFPLYHVDAAFLTVAPAIVLGCRAAIGRRFSVSGFWDEVREFDATVFDFMGATLTMLWKADSQPEDLDNPVRLAWGVPMVAWREQFEERFDLKLVHAYGLTDAGMICYESLDRNEPVGSCGIPSDQYDLRIFDENDNELPPGQVGEIVIRPLGPDLIMKGYWGAPEATLGAFRNLWFHTGDFGRIDEGGHLFFEGRKKDAIRRRGENISAFEIEEVLHSHPAIAEGVAIGVASELSEEDVKVVIVLKTGAALSREELREFCSTRMARYMVPDYVEFVSEIPKTPTGKPEKYRLVESHRVKGATRG